MKFDKAILLNDFHHNDVDKCIYSKFKKEFGVIICVYVNDMLIVITNMIVIVQTKRYLTFIFKMIDFSEVDTILCIEVKKHGSDYALNLSQYIEKILDKYKHLNIKEVNTSFDSSVKFNDNYNKTIEQLEYVVLLKVLCMLCIIQDRI